MKKFITQIIVFTIPLAILFYVRPFYLLANEKYKETVAGSEIYLSLKKSKEVSKSKILLIGDSVAKQLFDNQNNNDSINSLACNQAIGVIGQYFLLNNYINAGNKPEIVYMLYSPFSFKNNLDQIYTFHYFLKPFYIKEYIPEFSPTVFKQVKKIPYLLFCREPYILTSNWAPNFKTKDGISYDFLSPISKEYLHKIKEICDANGIDFYIIPTPTRISNKAIVDNFNKSEYLDLSSQNELALFLNNIPYFDDSLFVDNAHLKKPLLLKNNVIVLMNRIRAIQVLPNLRH